MSKLGSRGPDIDTEKCVDAVGGNRFNLVLIAANRARELKHRDRENPVYKPACVTAILEIQDGKVDARRYLMKVK